MNDSVLGQIKEALDGKNRLASFTGFALGGAAPAFTFFIGHFTLKSDAVLYGQMSSYMVLGGMIFSALTVYEWLKNAFRNPWKAFGYVMLIEGAMVFSPLLGIAACALVLLFVINGVATACNLVRDWRHRDEIAKAERKGAKR